MTKFVAKFSNGKTKTIENSKKQYTHAFCFCFHFVNDGAAGPEQTTIGFASSKELAEKGISREWPSVYDKTRNRWKKATNVVVTFQEIVEVKGE